VRGFLRYSTVSMETGEDVVVVEVMADWRRVWALREVEHFGLWKNVIVFGVLMVERCFVV
jgi:hypothetical protein